MAIYIGKEIVSGTSSKQDDFAAICDLLSSFSSDVSYYLLKGF